MQQLPPFIIAAIGAGLVGVFAGLSIVVPECFESAILVDGCWEKISRLRFWYFLIMVSAGIGGALNTKFFGKLECKEWQAVCYAVLGALLSTLYGGMCAGFLFTVAGLVDALASFDPVVLTAPLSLPFLTLAGAVSGFVVVIATWAGIAFWIFGFALLHLIIRNRRQLELLKA